MRNKYIIGNWKMNKTVEDTKELLNTFLVRLNEVKVPSNNKIVVCPPFTSLESANNILSESKITLGAQNVHFAEAGAYTGEISVEMLKNVGVTYCVVGHSERRAYFNETDDMVNKKVIALLEGKITPIICVGETLEQREQEIHKDIVEAQIRGAFSKIDIRVASDCIIAYEPVWAIGTGRTATEVQAEEMCEFIRYTIEKLYGTEVANSIHILYGGSVNKENAVSLLTQPNIDGALIGGASLKPEFVDIAVGQY